MKRSGRKGAKPVIITSVQQAGGLDYSEYVEGKRMAGCCLHFEQFKDYALVQRK